MSRAQRQRARTEMWQSNYGTETRGRPRVRSACGYRFVAWSDFQVGASVHGTRWRTRI